MGVIKNLWLLLGGAGLVTLTALVLLSQTVNPTVPYDTDDDVLLNDREAEHQPISTATAGTKGRPDTLLSVAAKTFSPWWHVSHDTPALADTKRYVMYQRDRTNGFNNQRIVLHVAVLLASLLNRTLVLEDYQESRHDSSAAGMDQYFDIEALQKAVPVVKRSDFEITFRCKPVPMDPNRKALLAEDIVDKYGADDSECLFLPIRWGFPRFMMAYRSDHLSLWHKAIARDYLHYTQELFDLAKRIALNLKVDQYDSVHMRVGDRRPLPLINCTARGFMPRDTRDRACTRENQPKRPVTMQTIVIDELKAMPDVGRVLYVATNDERNGVLRQFMTAVVDAGFKPLTMTQAISDNPELKQAVKALSGGQLGVVDQIVCAYGRHFFPSFPSMWDEIVVAIREWLDFPLAQEQLALFDTKIEEMMYHDYRFRKNAAALADRAFT